MHEANVLVGEVEPRLDVGEQVEQVARAVRASGWATPPASWARACFNSSRPPASITARTASARVRSSLPARKARSVNSPGWAARAPASQKLADQQLDQRRARERVQLGHVLAGVGPRRGQNVEVGGKW